MNRKYARTKPNLTNNYLTMLTCFEAMPQICFVSLCLEDISPRNRTDKAGFIFQITLSNISRCQPVCQLLLRERGVGATFGWVVAVPQYCGPALFHGVCLGQTCHS